MVSVSLCCEAAIVVKVAAGAPMQRKKGASFELVFISPV
jgi:hypothetical protein